MDDTNALSTPEQVVRLVHAFGRIASETVRERIIEQIEDLDPGTTIAPTIKDVAKPSH